MDLALLSVIEIQFIVKPYEMRLSLRSRFSGLPDGFDFTS